jgi:hypothetical protein
VKKRKSILEIGVAMLKGVTLHMYLTQTHARGLFQGVNVMILKIIPH